MLENLYVWQIQIQNIQFQTFTFTYLLTNRLAYSATLREATKNKIQIFHSFVPRNSLFSLNHHGGAQINRPKHYIGFLCGISDLYIVGKPKQKVYMKAGLKYLIHF